MRPTLIPNLLAVAMRNLDRGFSNIGVFEFGPEFSPKLPDRQRRVLATVRLGQTGLRHWRQKPRPLDSYDIKADIKAVFAAYIFPYNLQLAITFPKYHPAFGEHGIGQKYTGSIWPTSPKYQQEIGRKSPAYAGEIFLDNCHILG